MHVVQAITATHDRYLSVSPNSRRTIAEAYHCSRAAALFNQKLSKPVQPSDRDALWAAAALLGIIAISSIEASNPEEAWPLKSSEPSDLEWLRMSEGKMAIWEITNPLRPDSIFHTLADEFQNDSAYFVVARSGTEGIPPEFIQLCGLETTSSVHNNPFYAAVRVLALLLHIECDQSTTGKQLSFLTHMQPEFKILLEHKDPRALLLMAYWYAKVCHSQYVTFSWLSLSYSDVPWR